MARLRMLIAAVIALEAFAFLFAAVLHTGVDISFLPEFLHDPRIIGATVVEGICGTFLTVAAILVALQRHGAWVTAVSAHAFSIAADVFGLILIAVGAGPDSPFNYLFHRIGVLVLTVVLIWLFTPAVRRIHSAHAPAAGNPGQPSV